MHPERFHSSTLAQGGHEVKPVSVLAPFLVAEDYVASHSFQGLMVHEKVLVDFLSHGNPVILHATA